MLVQKGNNILYQCVHPFIVSQPHIYAQWQSCCKKYIVPAPALVSWHTFIIFPRALCGGTKCILNYHKQSQKLSAPCHTFSFYGFYVSASEKKVSLLDSPNWEPEPFVELLVAKDNCAIFCSSAKRNISCNHLHNKECSLQKAQHFCSNLSTI